MGEYKPLGSEKLSGDAKIKRILELTYYKPSDESKNSSEVIKESTTGVYGIVKEKDGYYVKKGLNESSMDYIGGMFMKNKNRFSSYNEALKKLEFLTEQEKLQTEATRYVLKQPTKSIPQEAPVAAPTNDATSAPPMPGGDAPNLGGDPSSSTPGDSLGGGEDKLGGGDNLGGSDDEDEDGGDFVKSIEKLTGRLQQKLEEHKDELEKDDIKYVFNMLASAVNASKDEIIEMIEDSDSEGNDSFGDDNPDGNPDEADMGNPDDNAGANGPVPSSPGDDDLDETMDTLENLVNTSFEEEQDVEDLGYAPEDDMTGPEQDRKFGPPSDKGNDFSGLDFSDISPDDDVVDSEEGMSPKELHRLSHGNGGMSLNEIDPTMEGDVKEIDINELTNIVNKGVKETLSKYFNQ